MAKKGSSIRKAKPSARSDERPSTPDAVGAKWSALLRLLPGYDPFASSKGTWFDYKAAEKAIDFVHECICHVEGALIGQPFVMEPWQQSFVANLFGWQREDDQGRIARRYREALLYVPRKNGKTPLAAAIALYVFFCDDEAGQQDYIAAADREQAGKLFRQAKGMVDREPELNARCKIYGGTASAGQSKSMVREEDGSFLQVVSADANTKHGGTSHLVIIDELHAQPDRDLVDVLTTSTASLNRKQTLTIYLTTADFNRPSICNEKHAEACRVRDGLREDQAFLPAIYELTRDADWRDESNWHLANPNLGISVSAEYLRRECKKAEDNLAYRATFCRLHLNMQTDSANALLDLLAWDATEGRFDEEELLGRECVGGLDLSTTTDLSAFVLLFRLDGGRYAVLCYFWSPEATARKRSHTDQVEYLAWAEAGHLKLTEGHVIDYDVIRADINALREKINITEIAADRWNATQIITQLKGDGLKVVAFGQGYQSMNSPTKELVKLVVSGKLIHSGHPVLRWMAGNLMAEENAAGDLKPSKDKSPDRIDGMVSLIMALGQSMVTPESQPIIVESW